MQLFPPCGRLLFMYFLPNVLRRQAEHLARQRLVVRPVRAPGGER